MTAPAPRGDWEGQHVSELRGRSPPTPWGHVAAQVGRNVVDVRRQYDPAFRAGDAVAPGQTLAVSPIAKPAESPRSKRLPAHIVRRTIERGSKPLIRAGTGMAAAALVLATRSASKTVVARRLGCSGVEATNVLSSLARKGFVISLRSTYPWTWSLTQLGHEAAEQLRAAK